jgi:hypothetical protein
MYSYIYRYIQKIILKKSFYDTFIKIIEKEKIKTIVEIGCADAPILDKLKNFVYYGYDTEKKFIKKLRNKYKNISKYNFDSTSIEKIDFKKHNPKTTIILLIGVFHHVNDTKISLFLKKTKKFKIYAVDAIRIEDQNFFTKFLLDNDVGKFVRYFTQYKDLLTDYSFFLARNKYLIFPYDHLISFKNLNCKKLLKKII